ncbi:hypothetical protein F2P56_015431 [Juglans regia]|uniref:Major allergen Pru ar 1-like n=2 Tax=Juglans regia TaxID=51240 RepID=A0A833XFS3_JUGRE|nr:major allergen Pru ar 1-like [Juglans regia]XP_035547410.1 major allergen Pru ar 1-like [Juglans regia]KAF5465394.1 hypothetical protein F2P56_015407 [Juglans regia]KAF5465420.1 hypothetical protein F2P56_015431 [Juglans regia]
MVLDSHNLILPKVMPQAVKSIDFIQGNGGPDSNRQVNFAEESYYYKYTVTEGDALEEKLEFIVHEVQLEPTPVGGSKNKMTTNYHTKGDIVITEEEIKAGKEKVLGM